jgi:hypothetical protein
MTREDAAMDLRWPHELSRAEWAIRSIALRQLYHLPILKPATKLEPSSDGIMHLVIEATRVFHDSDTFYGPDREAKACV